MNRFWFALLAALVVSSAGCYATVRPGYREERPPNGEWRQHDRGREFDDRDHDDRDHEHGRDHDR